MPTATTEKGLTIGEAADKLGIPKKTLRHILARPDRRVRLLHEYRDTKKGLATVEIIPADLLDELCATIIVVPVAANESADSAPTAEMPLELEAPVVEEPTSGDDITSSAIVQPDELKAAVIAPLQSSEPQAAVLIDEPVVENVAGDAESKPIAVESKPIEVASVPAQTFVPQQASVADTMLVVATYERLLSEKEARIADMRAALDAEREQTRRLTEALTREQAQRQIPIATAVAPVTVSERKGFWARVFGL